MQEADTLQRFIFENSHIRGSLIHLGASYRAVRQRYDYPDNVAAQLGQALVASALLSATIKYRGSLILQIQSSGPINMLVAQCTDERHIRGLARWQHPPEPGNLSQLYGEGRMVITIDNRRQEDRYQGIVGVEGESLADAIENYFRQSEQLETHLWLAADNDQAVGMLLQKLPGDEAADADMWNRIETLSATLTEQELLELPSRDILHRLFHEDDIRLFDPEPVSFRCSCSREKITTMLKSLGNAEIQSILDEQGKIEVGCDFCNQRYEFDEIDTKEIFVTDLQPPGSSTRH